MPVSQYTVYLYLALHVNPYADKWDLLLRMRTREGMAIAELMEVFSVGRATVYRVLG
ncbi:MAG: hypothetical protein JWN52_3144 [Actinomycetia bacterium]|nr:hypothetical protein [Actinomycetes bacterium]